MWPFKPRPKPQPELVPTAPIDLGAILKTLVVDKIEAEAKLEGAKIESELRRMRERDEIRQLRRERAIHNNKTLPRDSKGKLMKRTDQPVAETCAICNGARVFTDEQLAKHRAHPVVLSS